MAELGTKIKPTMITPNIEAEIRLRYAAIRLSMPEAIPIAVLHIGHERTAIAVGAEVDPEATLVLAVGSEKTAREYFKHTPPSPLELENAIAAVEDEVARARSLIPDAAGLYTTDASVRKIAMLSGASDGASIVLSLDALERIFERLASTVLGRPASHEGIPPDNDFAATLLILREFMHHMKFLAITVNGRSACKE